MAAATEDYRAKELMKVGDRAFEKRLPFMSYLQEVALNFYPERADFTRKIILGQGISDHLTSSYPIIARRELGNLLSSMLRPKGKKWFLAKVGYDEDASDNESDRWLEWATELQRRAMYDNDSGFVRATKEADHDYAAFGQGVISTQMNWKKLALRYRSHHIRDTCWFEDSTGQVERVDYKWHTEIHTVRQMFGEKALHPKMAADYAKDPYKEVECRHVVLPSDQYESSLKDSLGSPKRYKQPFVSVYIDVTNSHILEEVGSWTRIYTIPRWQTVSGSQYAFSPATIAALPDARLYQAMALTLLESGEKYTNPPMIAVQEAIRGDVNLFAGGITYVDEKYDERLGEVLRPLFQDKSGMNTGVEMQQEIKRAIHEAFFLNKINLPDRGSAEMTALETSQRVQEYVRDALPLFEPVTADYNGALCDITFETLRHANAFGDPNNIPQSIRGREVNFNFVSPLENAMDAVKGQQFGQAMALVGQAVGVDQSAGMIMDIKAALRDSIKGIGAPAKWLAPEAIVQQKEDAAAQEAQTAKMLAMIQQGAGAAKDAGAAAQSFSAIPGPQ